MKKLLLIIVGIAVVSYVYAESILNSGYEKAMQDGMKQLSEARTPLDFQNVSNSFARIAKTESDKWHPYYYASYTMTLSAAMDPSPNEKDKKLDEAETHLKLAAKIDHDEAEVLALQGFIHMIRIGVDPASRGQMFSAKSGEALQKAMARDPQNPRVLFMLAQLEYGTAQFMGSDFTRACELNEKAIALFESQDEKYGMSFEPSWGQGQAMGFRQNCNN